MFVNEHECAYANTFNIFKVWVVKRVLHEEDSLEKVVIPTLLMCQAHLIF
jgi:hypothetical protein